MHHKLQLQIELTIRAYIKVHGVFPSAIPISIFTIIQFHWVYTRTVGKSLPFVHVGTYPTGNFATLDRHSYSRLYRCLKNDFHKLLYTKIILVTYWHRQVSEPIIFIKFSRLLVFNKQSLPPILSHLSLLKFSLIKVFDNIYC